MIPRGIENVLVDTIRVVKKDGTRSEEMKANVTEKGILLFRTDVVVEAGDIVERYLSNGAVEKYEVTNPGFHEKLLALDAHYQMKVRNLAVSKDKKSPSSVIYNIQGDNNRIISDSADNSTNLVVKNNEMLQSVEELKKLLASSDLSDNDRSDATELIGELENQAQAESSSKAVKSALLEKLGKIAPFTPLVTSIMELLS